jgi:hypothetical protein
MAATVRNLASIKRADLSDRGGLVQIARRTSRVAPCYAPFKNLVIDWDGSVMVCCQVRSDVAAHKESVVAKIGDSDVGLIEAYVALAGWRDSLKGFGPKRSPCATCNVFEYDANGPAVLMIAKWLAEEKLPGARMLKEISSRVIGRTRRW